MIDQNRLLHESDSSYGAGNPYWLPILEELVVLLDTKNILDYGCGKGMLAKYLGYPIQEYDPHVDGKNALPEPADIVVTGCVLPHIEPDQLDSTLNHIQGLMKQDGLFLVAHEPSVNTLPNGLNAHLIQEDRAWWTKRLERYFRILDYGVFQTVVTTRPIPVEKTIFWVRR